MSVPPCGWTIDPSTVCTAASEVPLLRWRFAVTPDEKVAIATRVVLDVMDIPLTTDPMNVSVAVQSLAATDPEPSARKTRSTTAAQVGAVGARVGARVVGRAVVGAAVTVGARVTHDVVRVKLPWLDSYPSTTTT